MHISIQTVRVYTGFGFEPQVITFDSALILTSACARRIAERCRKRGCLSSYTPQHDERDPHVCHLEVDKIGFPDDEDANLPDWVEEVIREEMGRNECAKDKPS